MTLSIRKNPDLRAGWLGLGYHRYDGKASVADPRGIVKGFEILIGLMFATISVSRRYVN